MGGGPGELVMKALPAFCTLVGICAGGGVCVKVC